MNNPLQQYIELYDSMAPAIDAHAPHVLNARRTGAAGFLRESRLPRRGDEGYVYSSPEEMFAPDLGVNINRVPFRGDLAAALRTDVPLVSAVPLLVTNDHIDPAQPIFDRLPEGLTVCPMSQAEDKCPGVLERYYARLARPEDDAAVALNTMLAQDGVLIHVARGRNIGRPIQIVNLLSATSPVLAVRRLLIVLEQDASLSLVSCDHTHPDCAPSTVSSVIEIDLAPGSRLEFCELEESTADSARSMHLNARVDAMARLELVPVTLSCGHSRNNYLVSLDGENASLNIAAMGICTGKRIADSSATVLHNAPRCTSQQTFRYVAEDRARAAFEGLIRVARGAHHTEASQSSRNVVTSDSARVHTAPQLEIYCDDVKCSHGAATGSLDPRAMFYMQTRGIPRQTARAMLLQAFMSDVLDAVRIESLRQGLRRLVERRLSHGAIDGEAEAAELCENCGAC